MMENIQVKRNSSCDSCNYCKNYVSCARLTGECIGCGICLKGCPSHGLALEPTGQGLSMISLEVDGQTHLVPDRISLDRALTMLGKPHDEQVMCRTGGCWACEVVVDGVLARRCNTATREGMRIVTDPAVVSELPPTRVISFFPNHLHANMSVFTHGCNYGCDFCHNWDLTFSSIDRPLTPAQSAETTLRMMSHGKTGPSGRKRIGISGGEPTLNRRWLIEYVRLLRQDEPTLRIQLDTNASLLTRDYADELREAGVTDISPDLKGLHLETFQRISGVEDAVLAKTYLDRSWDAVEYVAGECADKFNVAVGLPYHPELIEQEEVVQMANRLGEIRPGLDVNLIVYQPAFRRREAGIVRLEDLKKLAVMLQSTKVNFWLQTGEDIPPPVTPDELPVSSEEFF